MDWNRLARVVVSFLATFLPIYLLERVANYYYLLDQPNTFFFFSGLRITLFPVFAVSGSIAAGMLLRNLRQAVATELVSVFTLLSAFYVLCSSPRVCYSTGLDGLEPLRLGFMLGSMCVFGASVGVAARTQSERRRSPAIPGTLAFFAMTIYFPAVYTFGGGHFFPLSYPWVTAALLALQAFATSVILTGLLGVRSAVFLPMLVLGVILSIAVPLAAAFLPDVAPVGLLLIIAVMAGSLTGGATSRFVRTPPRKRTITTLLAVVFLVLILGSFWIMPDEVNGLVPHSGGPGFAMGSPIYAGGYMDGNAAPALGIASWVSFAGVNSSIIKPDNYLSAGIGAHSPDCCVDGIDYAYRFDLYLFHNGSETLLASAWQACDDNAACGGHSWKVLMFSKSGPLPLGVNHSESVDLQIQWENHSAIWSYAHGFFRNPALMGFQQFIRFANFTAPAKENPAFNVGVVDTSSPFSSQQKAIFFQFGVMSRYPLGKDGWSVFFYCPAYYWDNTWTCVDNPQMVQGGSSYWKVLWKWGEDYPNVVGTAIHGGFNMTYP